MKFPTTFAWLSAAVVTACLAVFAINGLLHANDAPEKPVSAPAAPPETAPKSTDNRIQIAFLLDTSSSMDGLIDQAKARLWNILNEIGKAEKDGEAPDIEVALYHYGNTALLPEKGYIQQITPLTTDVDLISKELFALRTGGGDEFCGHVIQTSTKELAWDDSDNTVKLIYIAGNESFYQGDVNAKDALSAARQRGIVVNTIYCGDPNDSDGRTWQSTLGKGDGDFFFINQNEAVVFVPSPYDDRIENLNLELNRTYIPVGRQGASKKANQVAQDVNAAGYSKANLSSRAKFKVSKKYKNASWDLVDAAEAEPTKILKQKATLPDSLANLTDAALTAKIAYISEARNKLQKEMKDLTAQRDAFVAAEEQKLAGKETNTLDARINASVKQRLVEKKYVVKE